MNPTGSPGSPAISNCDFESGLCGFTNDVAGDIFDWTLQAGRTASGNTGPSADHTLGTSSGVFSFYYCTGLSIGKYIFEKVKGHTENKGLFWFPGFKLVTTRKKSEHVKIIYISKFLIFIF